MSFVLESNAELEALSNIRSIASSISQQFATFEDSQSPSIRWTSPFLPHLDLAFPSDILQPIHDLQLPPSVQDDILQRFHRLFTELRDSYSGAYRKTCQTLSRNSYFKPDMLVNLYESRFRQRCFPMVQSQVAFVLAEAAKYQQSTPTETKNTFNHDYLPALETYFSLNAYPSVAHRSILAQTSGMSPRQIEVWFQNHRNRAKKENKPTNRLSSEYPLNQALAIVKQSVPSHRERLPTPPAEITSDVLNKKAKSQIAISATISSRAMDHTAQNILLNPYGHRPPHAFPATKKLQYPDPFPNDDGVFKFTPIEWRRKPVTKSIPATTVDMEGFTQMFHMKLNFSENRRRGSTPPAQELSSHRPWYTSTTTLPIPAPHPALIRISRPPTLMRLSPKDLVIKPTFGSSSLPRTTPLPSPSVDPSSRKVKRLPQRKPPQSRTRSFGSRTSSFSSETSSGRRFSSSSSSYSSPEPSTPPALPHLDIPVVQDLFDLSYPGFDIGSPFHDSPDFPIPHSDQTSNKRHSDSPLFDTTIPEFGHDLGDFVF